MGVTSKHFGVITPFRAQVLILRRVLRSRNLGNVNVGTGKDDYDAKHEKTDSQSFFI